MAGAIVPGKLRASRHVVPLGLLELKHVGRVVRVLLCFCQRSKSLIRFFRPGVEESVDVHAQRHYPRHASDQLARLVHPQLFVEQAEQSDRQQSAVVVNLRRAHLDDAAVLAKRFDDDGTRHVAVLRGSSGKPYLSLLRGPKSDRGQNQSLAELFYLFFRSLAAALQL